MTIRIQPPEGVELRPMTDEDAPIVGGLIYRAIARAFRDHGQPEPIADDDEGEGIARRYLAIDRETATVAVREGTIRGAGFLHIRDEIASLGPVVVEPEFQGQGLGRLLVEHLSLRASRCASTRLFIDAFNMRAFGNVLKRGYVPRDHGIRLVALGGLKGPGMMQAIAPAPIRELAPGDLGRVVLFDSSFFGGSRERDFKALIAAGASGLIAEEDGKVLGYLLARVEGNLATIGPGSAESADLLGKLLARLGERLAGKANIILAYLLASQNDVVLEAFSMGFRATNLSVYMVRGSYTPVIRPAAVAIPPDVV